MNKLFLAAAAGAACFAAPAFAQTGSAADYLGEAAPHTGPRVEATVGWDRIVLHIDDESGGQSGVTYGGEIGYDVQVGGAVLGAYAGVDGASTEECVVAGTERACIRADRNITAGVRAGVALGSRSLLYAKGGYSNGSIRASYTDSAFPADNDSASEDFDGFHVGAGLEVGFARNVYGKVEYNYTNYAVDDEDFGIDLDRHRVLAGIGIRF